MERNYEIRLPDGTVAIKPCLVANEGMLIEAIPSTYLANLKYVNSSGEVKELLGTLTHTVVKEDKASYITEFEFRLRNFSHVRKSSVVFIKMSAKETYAVGVRDFVLNFLVGGRRTFSLFQQEDMRPFATGVDVLYGEFNLGRIWQIVSKLREKKNLSMASDLYETIRAELSTLSTDAVRRGQLMHDVVCTPLDNATMEAIAPILEVYDVSFLESKHGEPSNTNSKKPHVIEIRKPFNKNRALFFDGARWYLYSDGYRILDNLLDAMDDLMDIIKKVG